MSAPVFAGKLDGGSLPVANRRVLTPALALLYLMWIFTLFEPQRFLPSFTGGGAIMQRLVLALLIPTLLVAVRSAGARAIYLPLALFALVHVVNVPFAYNRGLAFTGLKSVIVIFILFYATVSVIDTPKKILGILKLLLLSFVWYLVQGNLRSGGVTWHPTLANPDSFGTLAAIAVGFGFYFGLAAKIPRWRYLGFATAALGMLGIVVSFARGAFLAGAVVVGFIWIRSPRKIATLAAGLVAGALLLVAISAIYPQGEFWAEVKSIAEEGTTTGTGKDRWEIWRAALIVFREHPALGAGAYNVGVVGSVIIPDGFLDLKYENASKLYNKALHNAYLQILSEEGLVGFAIWLWMLVDFARRTRRMRAPRAAKVWAERGGGGFDLHRISLALEGGMLGFLCGAFFYNMTYRHWFFTFTVLALCISRSLQIAKNRIDSIPRASKSSATIERQFFDPRSS